MRLDAATVLLQWATGGLACLWVTARHRLVGLGYGWLLRGVFGGLGALGVALEVSSGREGGAHVIVLAGGGALVVAALAVLALNVARRGAPAGAREQRARRRARVAAMIGRPARDGGARDGNGREPPPAALDLLAPAAGLLALLGAASLAGGPYALAAGRLLAGAAFLGAVTDAMLLGHWYLVQPGLARKPIRELVRVGACAWAVEIAVLCWPTGMPDALTGRVDDGYGGLVTGMWVVAAASTIVLLGVAWLALRERYYSAVMAATGLLYLALLTAFGTDVVARLVLSR